MSQFMLLLYDNGENWAKLSPEEMQKGLEKYMAWMKKPFTLASQKLTPDAGHVIRSEGGRGTVSDGPYSETKEVLGGFYVIEAASYEEAVQLALQNPHVEYGGTIEVRHVWT